MLDYETSKHNFVVFGLILLLKNPTESKFQPLGEGELEEFGLKFLSLFFHYHKW